MRTLTWPDDPEPQEPDAATLLEEENRRLREIMQQQESTIQQLQGVLRCAAKVLAPYARGHR